MEVVNSDEKFESDDLSYTKAVIGETITLNDSEQKVLGLRWDSMEDELSISFEKVVMLSDSLLPTKRNLLKLSASIFDPFGLISAVTVQFRILLQDICKLRSGWDTPLPQNLAKIWYELIEDLKHVRVISVPRYYFSEVMDKAESYTLHVFGDASEKAFCTIVYVVIKVHSAYHPRLITSKSRVAPIKPLAMPHMELLAALISARLLNTVRQALES